MSHTAKEIVEGGLKRGINAALVNCPADVLGSHQLKARNYWVGLDHPEPGIKLIYPKYFFLSNQTENFVQRRAPLIGEDNEDIYVKELGLSSPEITALEKAGVI
jgi:formyl-CoA transferase